MTGKIFRQYSKIAVVAAVLSAVPAPAVWAQTSGTAASAGTGSTQSLSGAVATSSELLRGGAPIELGQEPAVYDLAATIATTLRTSSDLQIALTNLRRDQGRVEEAASASRPKVTGTAQEVHLDSPISVAVNGNSLQVQPKDTQTIAGQASLPIDISGSIRATTQQSELQELADRFQVDRTRNDLILSAQTVYFNVLRAQHQVQVAQAGLADAQTQLSTAQSQYAGGIGQKIDAYRASTQVSTAQQVLDNAENALALAQENFNNVVGRALTESVVVQDVPGVTIGATVTNNPDASVLEPTAQQLHLFKAPTTSIDNINVQKDINYAFKARPELRVDEVNVQADAKQIIISRSGYYPTLTLAATGDYYPITDFQNPRHSLGVYTATVSIPLYDGGLTHGRIQEARANQTNAVTTLGSDKTTIELQVRQAYLNLYNTSNDIASADAALQEAIAARQLAQVRFAGGVGLYLEVTDAESALTSAENSQVNAVYDYLIARAQYENAVGSPNTTPAL